MSSPHADGAPLDGADWNEQYKGQEHLWSDEPNGALVTEVSDLVTGRALDIGCGEGADAIWLASRGWQVTGLDISQVAIDRATAAARDRGVTVEWICADIVAEPPIGSSYDLVVAMYPAILRSAGDAAIYGLLRGVAPGGTLLVVDHEITDPDQALSHGFDPDDYVQPGDIAGLLDDGWDVTVLERRPRAHAPSHASQFADDSVLKARRSALLHP
jgi:SAM-dependent methyltransferase